MEIVSIISLIVLGITLYQAYLLFMFPKTEESFAKRYPKYYKHVTDLSEKFGIPTFEIGPLGPAFSWSSYSKTFPYYKRISLEYKTGKLYLDTSRSGPFNSLYYDYPVSENNLKKAIEWYEPSLKEGWIRRK